MPPQTPATDAPLLLYDGECGLCSHAVQFILRRDRRRRMLFAPLQSETGREVLAAAGLDPSDLTTMILRTGPGAVLVRSDAALTAAADLRGPWRWAAGLRWIPRPIRDAVYRLIARFRHRIFPAPAACLLPDPGDAHRFID
jgi:predicted DCC family thiol-disulfide oxidoreductase YuxK